MEMEQLFFFSREEPASFDIRYLEEGRVEHWEYREKLELVALTNILELQENCGLRKLSAFWKFWVDKAERENIVNGSVVGVMEPIMSLKVLKSIYFESCELWWEYKECSNMKLQCAQVL